MTPTDAFQLIARRRVAGRRSVDRFKLAEAPPSLALID